MFRFPEYCRCTKVIVAGVFAASIQSASAAEIKALHNFPSYGQDGYTPYGGLVFDTKGNLYRTTSSGGDKHVLNGGTVFKITSNHVYTVLHEFGAGSDGRVPYSNLIVDGEGNLYGTTLLGGTGNCYGGCGIIFKVTRDGRESQLYDFQGAPDGQSPYSSLLLDGSGNMYGTTYGGGADGAGTVFKILHHHAETVLYSFSGGSDGGNPFAGLAIDANGTLYGTTIDGGEYGGGTAFSVSASGAFSVLHSFGNSTDGSEPHSALVIDSNGNLFGTTTVGGTYGYGTVYEIAPSGTETIIYNFTYKADGGRPIGNVLIANDGSGNLFGTTSGGAYGWGVLFELAPSGAESVLYTFQVGKDGEIPVAGLIEDSNGNLYGTTSMGGRARRNKCFTGCGTVFELKR